MNSSLQFFMTKEDEEEFMDTFKEADFDYLEKDEESISRYYYYKCGKEHIQLLLCKQFDEVLVQGHIGIKTHYKNEDTKRCESLYRKMKRWIQKNFIGNVVSYNYKFENRKEAGLISKKSWWISPYIAELLNNKEIVLKQSKNGFIIFDIYREEIDGEIKK